MRYETITKLNAINLRFYRQRADEFSRTRRRPWAGWHRVAEAIERHRQVRSGRLSVLDLGCGNGRWGFYLGERLGRAFKYCGVDISRPLLREAEEWLADGPAHVVLKNLDLVAGRSLAEVLGPARFDIITVFGLMHHLPGYQARRRLVQRAARLLRPGGSLWLSSWRFADVERFQLRVLSWREYNRFADDPIDVGDLDRGDVLLRWGRDRSRASVRYCHAADDDELARLVRASGLEARQRFRADGQDGGLNLYLELAASETDERGSTPSSRSR